MKNRVLLLVVMLAMILGFFVPQQAYAVSEAGVIFLLIEPGSRPGGMGQAYVAQVDDALAGYWNPGAMAFNRKTQFAGMHTNWLGDVFDDIYIEHLAWNQHFQDIGNIGAHVMFLTYGKQDRMDEDGQHLGEFSSYELAVAATYAEQVSQNLGLGLNFKFILSDLAPEGTGQTEVGVKGRGISYAFDLGLKSRGVDFGQIAVSPYNGVIAVYNGLGRLIGYRPAGYSNFSLPVRKLDFGLNLQNVGPNIVYIDDAQSDPLPMNWRMGFSYRMIESKYNKLSFNADMNKLLANSDPFYQRIVTAWFDDSTKEELESTIFNVGAEYTYYNLLSLRGGYIYDKAGDIIGPSFGAGIQYTFSSQYKVSFDFAMQQGGGLVDYNKTFSLGLEF
ncbi:MAG: PorV/PorQ family protein [Candidatus Cloacimonadia bacterium]